MCADSKIGHHITFKDEQGRGPAAGVYKDRLERRGLLRKRVMRTYMVITGLDAGTAIYETVWVGWLWQRAPVNRRGFAVGNWERTV